MNFLRRYKFVDTLVLLVLAVALVKPVFKLKYLDNWPSIESTFISDARLLAERMPHPGWQPLWYCGTRFDYIYPPALRYGTALISLIGHASTAKGYHIYIGLLYVFGIIAIYWLVLTGSGSRGSAWLSAAAVALVSPSLILFHLLHDDSPWMVPQRMHALMSYGEGPHISALSVLPAALAAAFAALRDRSVRAIALAGLLCAFTVANNFYGATALAMFFPVLTWSVWICMRDRTVWLRAAAIAALAYGLDAVWLTPSYLRITWHNLKWVATPGDRASRLVLLIALAIYCDFSWRWAHRKPDRIWPLFVIGSAILFTIDVAGFFYNGLRILGEPGRLAPELDLALLLLIVFFISLLWRRRKFRVEAVALTVLMFVPAVVYLQHAWSPFPSVANWQTQYELRMTRWVHENLPNLRVMPSGTNRFWYDAWYDNAEPGGGSDQGMLNQILPWGLFQVTYNERVDVGVLWLQAMGTDAVIVPEKNSLEYYHDYPNPEKFRGMLPVIYDDGHGTIVYRIPRIYQGLGRVVDRPTQQAMHALKDGDDLDTLRQYVALLEAPGQSETTVAWSGFEALQMKASVGEGQSVVLQETYDPAWHAYENGKPVAIRKDPVMTFMVMDVAPGSHVLDLRFETPLENRIGQIVSLLSLVLAALGICLPARMLRGRGQDAGVRS